MEHLLYKEGRWWVVKSQTFDGRHSLRLKYRSEPSKEQLAADYEFLDSKLFLAQAHAKEGDEQTG